MMAGVYLRVVVLPVVGSDQWPIILEWENVGINPHRPFRFEKLWILHPEFHEKLKEWWDSFPPIRGTRMYQFQQKIKLLKGHIKKWNKESFGNIFQEKQALESKIKLNQSQWMNYGFRKIYCYRNSVKENNRRKSTGTRMKESSGSKKENTTLSFSTKRPFNIDRGIEWID